MPLTALIADDHQIVRQGVRTLLEGAGIEVVGEAVDGDEALKSVEKLQPDLLVLDLMLPGVPGLKVLSELKTGITKPRL